jgi:hypothetical protein
MTEPVQDVTTRAALETVLAYQNQDVIDRYVVDYDADPEHAKLLFEDVKRWLWLCAEARRDRHEGIEAPMPTIFDEQSELDDVWHTFILFTPAYVKFCIGFFGVYLHHEPTPERVKQGYRDAPEDERAKASAEQVALHRAMASYVFDKLGPEVARRWYLNPRHVKAA